MDTFHDVIAFAVKGFIVFATVAAIVAFCVAVLRRKRPREWLRVNRLNRRIDALGDALRVNLMRKREFRKLRKGRKKSAGAIATARPNVFVLDFKGDLFATAVRNLREEVTAIIAAAGNADEVVVRLESAGGAVPHYGLAAAQLLRRYGRAIGLEPGFTILDRSDSEDVINLLRTQHGLHDKARHFPRKNTLNEIFSKAANKLLPVEDVVLQEFPQFEEEIEDLQQLQRAFDAWKAHSQPVAPTTGVSQ